MLNQGEDKDLDEEIERTLTGSHAHPLFGDGSDEEVCEPCGFQLSWSWLLWNQDLFLHVVFVSGSVCL